MKTTTSKEAIMTEQEYLASYNAKDFDSPLVTVDSVLFTIREGDLHVLLVKRANHPFINHWGLAGGFIDLEADAELADCAIRKLTEKTGIAPPYLKQLSTRGNAKRDPRGYSVSTGFYALIDHQECTALNADVSDAQWFKFTALPEQLAFDHREIIEYAYTRLTNDARFRLVVAHALPKQFTLAQFQAAHEVILGQPLSKASFRRRIERAQVLESTGEFCKKHARPAELFRVKPELDNYEFDQSIAMN